jgi:hypothetical protein
MLPNNIYSGTTPLTAEKLTILIQNYYKLLQNVLCLQQLYYALIANLSSSCIVTGAVTSGLLHTFFTAEIGVLKY